jgi:membrane associated rhomboid family serine protease
VFVPLHDTNPLKSIDYQYVTVSLIVLNIAIYLIFQTGWFIPLDEENLAAFAAIPAELMGQGLGDETIVSPFLVPERFTLFTYMFLHGSWIHLLGNMLFLWVFGDNIEDAMGHVRFIMFFLMCGIFAAVLHSWMNPTSDLPLIGASGAVAGVISAYLILHPKVKVWVLALWRIPIRITAAGRSAFGCRAVRQPPVRRRGNVPGRPISAGFWPPGVLILFMRRRGVVLFDKTRGGA